MNGKFMISYDVESLFTNIPLNESIDLTILYILKGNSDVKLTADELSTLFHFATVQPTANLFLGHYENIWLDFNYNSSLAHLYHRGCVDDTFCSFSSEDEADQNFYFINSRHPNIKFTFEKELDHKISFLDVLVDNSLATPVISVFRKNTYTGLLTNFFSFVPFCYKIGLIRTLLDRTYRINNTWSGFNSDIQKVFNILRKIVFLCISLKD